MGKGGGTKQARWPKIPLLSLLKEGMQGDKDHYILGNEGVTDGPTTQTELKTRATHETTRRGEKRENTW